MSLRKPPEARRHYIKRNLALKPLKDIAVDCGVSEKTIDRDIAHMKETGEYQEWINLEFLRLHIEGDIKDDAKYRELARLYSKTMVQKTEVAGSVSTEFRVVFDKSMDDNGEADNPV